MKDCPNSFRKSLHNWRYLDKLQLRETSEIMYESNKMIWVKLLLERIKMRQKKEW